MEEQSKETIEETINVLIIGDIIGEPGIQILKQNLPGVKKKYSIDYIIANGENCYKGFGISKKEFEILISLGINIITSGNHIWSDKKVEKLLEENNNLLRPNNYFDAKGRGFFIDTVKSEKIAIVNLIGRYNMTPVDCPYQSLKKLIDDELKNINMIIVDFHAELMQEKKTLWNMFDGKISFLAGTHTHVQTADEIISKKGTGYISDIGMTGGVDSVIGMEKEYILEKNIKQINVPYIPSDKNLKIQGVVVTLDCKTGKTKKIIKINE